MNKLSIQIALMFLFFGTIWFGLSQIDWLDKFEVKKKASKVEQKLGDFYLQHISFLGQKIEEDKLKQPVEDIKNIICKSNNINPEKIKIHLLKSSQVNAMALPDNHMVIFTGLISYCKSAEELAGVMAHEIAHMEKNHIMKKLSKEIGLSALLSTITSGSVGVEIFEVITSKAYDRSMEAEADQEGIKYLKKSSINPLPMADMMFRLSLDEAPALKYMSFLSTHPDTSERVDKMIEYAGEEVINYPALLEEIDWEEYKEVF